MSADRQPPESNLSETVGLLRPLLPDIDRSPQPSVVLQSSRPRNGAVVSGLTSRASPGRAASMTLVAEVARDLRLQMTSKDVQPEDARGRHVRAQSWPPKPRRPPSVDLNMSSTSVSRCPLRRFTLDSKSRCHDGWALSLVDGVVSRQRCRGGPARCEGGVVAPSAPVQARHPPRMPEEALPETLPSEPSFEAERVFTESVDMHADLASPPVPVPVPAQRERVFMMRASCSRDGASSRSRQEWESAVQTRWWSCFRRASKRTEVRFGCASGISCETQLTRRKPRQRLGPVRQRHQQYEGQRLQQTKHFSRQLMQDS